MQFNIQKHYNVMKSYYKVDKDGYLIIPNRDIIIMVVFFLFTLFIMPPLVRFVKKIITGKESVRSIEDIKAKYNKQ
jgi:hypothetical protein